MFIYKRFIVFSHTNEVYVRENVVRIEVATTLPIVIVLGRNNKFLTADENSCIIYITLATVVS